MSLAGKTNYRLKLQVITPLFVGGGDSTKLTRLNYAFVPDEKKVYVLDERKWINYLLSTGLFNEYAAFIQQKAKDGGFDTFRWLKEKEYRIKNRAVAVFKQVSKVVYSTAEHPDFKTNDIHGFIKNTAGLPYIPGSSIKGALRTAVVASLLHREAAPNQKYLQKMEAILGGASDGKYKKKDVERLGQEIEKNLLDYRKHINGRLEDFKGMAGISVSDSTPFPPESLVLVKKRDLSLVDGRLKGEDERAGALPLYRECARPGTEVEFSLTIDSFKIKMEYGITTFDDIAVCLQKRFEALFGSAGVISVWPGSMKFLPGEALKDSGKGVLIMGGGAGYHSKSVISSLAADPKKANELSKKVMQMVFPRHKHFQDRPLSPRALKVARVNGKDMFMGICRIRES
ncbi:MAG: type III-A CRISPR-associated RAMP protein Csm5 [Peptococcaceae bacterium]|jgi:CRISPR-associated protein Csm5|nr:type III-A CRISPR-associated RAMP protein Csm5 [Peptococcaceae bacterium]MDH7524147.1 type III-A CRISPR-associated RAMP protein Csm5 [Peptococcaceae bacterium]